mmetsp:Transcript_50764/g.133835  ORF Transcript_50764/g.133835 Transcript_50764/m.133835 type:complete len:82 (-) Transcript_50764:153-398(-)
MLPPMASQQSFYFVFLRSAVGSRAACRHSRELKLFAPGVTPMPLRPAQAGVEANFPVPISACMRLQFAVPRRKAARHSEHG